jgi:TatD DNase family protein
LRGTPSPGVTDVHCHVERHDDPRAVAERAAEAGVAIFHVTFLPSDYAALEDVPGTSRGLGFHPMAARGAFPWQESIDIERELDLFVELAPGAPWIGEVGLDSSPEGAPVRELQDRILATVLSAPGVSDRFITVHSRYAIEDVLSALTRAGATRAAIHGNGFTGGVTEIEAVLDAGFSFSLVPSMFYEERGRAVIESVPRDRMLVESDAPFGIVDGRAVEPAELGDAVARLAELWQTTEEDVSQQLAANLVRLVAGTPAAAR